MCAARVDNEQSIRSAIDPDSIFLLELGVDTEGELRRIADLEYSVGFEKRARKEEPEEGQEPRDEESGDHRPDKTAAFAVNLGEGRGSGDPASGCCFRGAHCRRANVLCGIDSGLGRRLSRFRIRIDLIGLQLRHESLLLFVSLALI